MNTRRAPGPTRRWSICAGARSWPTAAPRPRARCSSTPCRSSRTPTAPTRRASLTALDGHRTTVGPPTKRTSARPCAGSRPPRSPRARRAGRCGAMATGPHPGVGPLRLGRAQEPARQRGRRQRHHADAPVLRSRPSRARPACCASSVPGTIKEIFLVRGAPESVSSSLPSERFGEYLVAKGVLRPRRSRARARHAAALQRQAGRHARRARAAAAARRVPAAVAAGPRSRHRGVRLDRGHVRFLPRRHEPQRRASRSGSTRSRSWARAS